MSADVDVYFLMENQENCRLMTVRPRRKQQRSAPRNICQSAAGLTQLAFSASNIPVQQPMETSVRPAQLMRSSPGQRGNALRTNVLILSFILP